MVVGLGSGEASDLAIRYLGHQLRSGSVQDVVGVPMWESFCFDSWIMFHSICCYKFFLWWLLFRSARSASEAAKYGVPLKHFRDDFQVAVFFKPVWPIIQLWDVMFAVWLFIYVDWFCIPWCWCCRRGYACLSYREEENNRGRWLYSAAKGFV